MKARIILADDHEVVRQGLRDVIAATTDMMVCAEAADGLGAERLARAGVGDMLLLEIGRPGRRGMQVLQSLRADHNAMPVVFFSMYPSAQYAASARAAGAQGYVGKDASTADLLQAMRRVLAGGTSFPPVRKRAARAAKSDDPFSELSRREIEVMQGLIRGVSLRDLSASLGVGSKSISTYRSRLMTKLGVESNVELAALAARHGYT